MDARIVPAGDSAWLIELPDRLDAAVNARAIDIAARIQAEHLTAVTDVVIGYRTVMVYVRPLAESAADVVSTLERVLAEDRPIQATDNPVTVTIPVCYGGPFGPDLPDVSHFASLTPDEVVQRHLNREYRVFMVGFVPGFAYMAEVDPRIAAPRRGTPRLQVPAGSVAIASGQTGIYPDTTPGGWNIIGRTPVRPYNPERPEAFLLRAGDRVRFRRIPLDEYHATSEWDDR